MNADNMVKSFYFTNRCEVIRDIKDLLVLSANQIRRRRRERERERERERKRERRKATRRLVSVALYSAALFAGAS